MDNKTLTMDTKIPKSGHQFTPDVAVTFLREV